MANVLRMADQAAIIALWQRGWSQRRIARETGFDRSTVARHVRLERTTRRPEASRTPDADHPKPAISITGSEPRDGPDNATTANSNPAISTAGAEPASRADGGPASEAGRQSLCEPVREIIEPKLEAGLSAQRIWQDLVSEHGFEGSDQSVRRFCRRMRSRLPLPFRRMECEPGVEAQVDFGTGAAVVIPEGKPLPLGVKTRRRKTHVFRIVLSHSRKAYSEVVYRQTTDDFIRCIENAFRYFSGVTQTLVIDNLKAAVTKADWFDPELNPKIQSFCRHYGTVILPTKPRMPRHKGKIERGIDYVQENALKGRKFTSLAEQNRFLMEWERQVADTRIHGTTRKQIKKAFEEIEKPTLLALPVERFPLFAESKRKVNRDGHVEVAKAYYSVPPEYLGRQVWVRWDGRTVRVFSQRFQQIAYHVQRDPGKFSTLDQHLPRRKRSGIEQGATALLRKIELIGVDAGRWADQMIACRGIEGIRVLMGVLNMANKHESPRINEACRIALTHGAYRLRTIRELIKRQGDSQEQFAFIQEHPIIRSLSDYEEWVHTAITKEPRS